MAGDASVARNLTYRIGEMDCAGCAATIRKAVSGLPGASDVAVSVPREQLNLVLDERRTSEERLVKILRQLGYSAERMSGCDDASGVGRACCGRSGTSGPSEAHAPGQTVIAVGGMDCASCAGTIRTALEKLPGISDLHVSVGRERVTLTLAPETTTAEQVRETIRRLGFDAGDTTATTDPQVAPDRANWWQQPKARHLGLAAGMVAAAYAVSLAQPELGQPAFAAATIVPLWPIARRALVAARLGAVFTIQMLMTLAALGALVIGEQAEAAIVVLLFIAGEMLEGFAAERARSGIRALGELLPRDALVEEDGVTRTVPASSLAVGQVVVVRPGDRVAADGEVTSGMSSVDESPVTGESIPVPKEPGDRVRAGTVNHDATLRLRVDRAPEDNTVARIIALVEEAQDAKAPTERFIDRFSRVYMPLVLGVAVLVAVVPPLAGGGDWQTWTYRALALLLIGCPCALVISVPAAIASSLSTAARHGMLIKGGAVMETLAGTGRVIFDKTGTLTLGKPRVTDVEPLAGMSTPDLLSLAAAVERESSHPLASAIVAHADAAGGPRRAAEGVRIVPGRGMEGVVEGRAVFIGAPRHAAERAALDAVASSRIVSLEAAGKTVAVVVAGDRAAGLIALRDEPRDEARAALEALKADRVPALMLTGDNARTGAAIGRQLGIDVETGMLPEDKAARVRDAARRETVVMVGDGVNDAPALAAAHVGVAVGSGTDVAMEAADAALMRNRIDDVPRMIGLARATMRNIRQNVSIALGLKAVFLVTTVTGLSGLWMAILADTGATVLVTLNAMRLLGHFRGERHGAAPRGPVAPLPASTAAPG